MGKGPWKIEHRSNGKYLVVAPGVVDDREQDTFREAYERMQFLNCLYPDGDPEAKS